MSYLQTTLSDVAMYVGIAGLGYAMSGLKGASALLFVAGIMYGIANRYAYP